MDLENLEDFYDKYGQYNVLLDRLNIPSYSIAYSIAKTKKIIQKLALEKLSAVAKKKIRVLDIGSGDGGDLIRLAMLTNKNIEFTGTDLSKSFIKYSNLAAAKKGLKNCRFFYDDLEKSKLRGKFDLIMCSEVLEHLKNPKKAVLTIASLLNPKGYLIITTPNDNNVLKYPFLLLKKQVAQKNIDGLTKNLIESEKHFKTEEQHLFIFSPDQLKKNLKKAGLGDIGQFRSSLTFGGEWFDDKPLIFSLVTIFDKILDLLPFKNTGWDLIFLARKK